MTHVQTDLNGRVDPTEMLDQMLATWDDQAYETALDEFETAITEASETMQAAEQDPESVDPGWAQRVTDHIGQAFNAVRNADQTRTDNQQKAALT
jgi:hypothetical protein